MDKFHECKTCIKIGTDDCPKSSGGEKVMVDGGCMFWKQNELKVYEYGVIRKLTILEAFERRQEEAV